LIPVVVSVIDVDPEPDPSPEMVIVWFAVRYDPGAWNCPDNPRLVTAVAPVPVSPVISARSPALNADPVDTTIPDVATAGTVGNVASDKSPLKYWAVVPVVIVG